LVGWIAKRKMTMALRGPERQDGNNKLQPWLCVYIRHRRSEPDDTRLRERSFFSLVLLCVEMLVKLEKGEHSVICDCYSIVYEACLHDVCFEDLFDPVPSH